MNVVPGRCDFCPNPGVLVKCACVHEHIVGVNVCDEKHASFLASGEIGCRVCQDDIWAGSRHFCVLSALPEGGSDAT